MPDFPIIDTHVHFTDQQRISYSWTKEVPEFDRDFTVDDFRAACGAVEVEGMVFVEVNCDGFDRISEADWVSELAKADPRIQGIVASSPLEDGCAATDQLERLASNPLVKGIRRLLEIEDVEFCLQPSFIEGVRLLPQYDLSFDICCYHRHLANVLELVRCCEGVCFILDHIGKPGIREGLTEPWKSHIRELAGFPNVYCKLSGMVTEADHQQWTPADLEPYVGHVVDCFGVDRMMFGGDWFVATLATTYPRWVATVDELLSHLSASELHRLYVDNAKEIYRLTGTS